MDTRVSLKRILCWTDKLLSYRLALMITFFLFLVVGLLALTPLAKALLKPLATNWADHFLAFACISFFIPTVKPKYALRVAACCLVYGGAIEVLQPFVHRHADWSDFLADSLGIIFGVSSGLIFYLMRKDSVS